MRMRMAETENNFKVTEDQVIDQYHASRRRTILKAHPEIRELMTNDPSFKYVAIVCALTQLLIAYLLRDESMGFIIIMGVFAGTFFDSAMTNAVHELTHEMAIEGNPLANKFLSGFVNIAMIIPFAAEYHKSHRHHHAYLGTDLDAKYPTMEEALQHDQTVFGRLKYMFGHPLQGYRPLEERWSRIVPNETPSSFVTWNRRTVWLADILIFTFWGYKSSLYLLLAFYVSDTIFIQGIFNHVDHWVSETETHTSSYYGWINMINFNVGYHREHHDFPNIPLRYLPMVKNLAAEFYSDEKYIARHLLGATWDILKAEAGKGLTKHANKLPFRQVSMKG